MPDYKELYFHLAGKLADAIEMLDSLSENLKTAQQHEEQAIIDENEITPIE